jgi:hypothetical protein
MNRQQVKEGMKMNKNLVIKIAPFGNINQSSMQKSEDQKASESAIINKDDRVKFETIQNNFPNINTN